MMFSENECRELAAFFAKRFSEPSVRTMLAQQAGIKEDLDNDQPDRAWERLITAAQNRRKLPKLAILAAKTDAADQNLQAVCNLLGARSRIVRNRSVAAAAAAVLAVSFGYVGFTIGTEESPQPLADYSATTAGATANDATTVAVAATDAAANTDTNAPTKPAQEPVVDDIAEVAPEPVEPAYVTAHTPPDERPRGPAWRDGRCTYDNPGDFIGYWYAGADLPGRKGEIAEVKLGVNVRMDYPGLHNDFNTRAKVRCILKRGDKVKLSDAAILVPPDKYWVPLYHGDLVEEAPEENLVAVR